MRIKPVKPIKSERDDRRALKEIDGLMDARPGTVEGDRLDVLVTLVEACRLHERLGISAEALIRARRVKPAA